MKKIRVSLIVVIVNLLIFVAGIGGVFLLQRKEPLDVCIVFDVYEVIVNNKNNSLIVLNLPIPLYGDGEVVEFNYTTQNFIAGRGNLSLIDTVHGKALLIESNSSKIVYIAKTRVICTVTALSMVSRGDPRERQYFVWVYLNSKDVVNLTIRHHREKSEYGDMIGYPIPVQLSPGWQEVLVYPLRNSLHIDDGSMGGGGQNIVHPADGRLGMEIVPGPNNDFYDYKGTQASPSGFFDWSRKGVFHYCLLVHDVFDITRHQDADGFGEGPQPNSPQGRVGGDDFMIQDVGSNVAELFMHELGHNLGLTDKPTTDAWAMFGEPGYTGHVDYILTDWNAVNLGLVQDTNFPD